MQDNKIATLINNIDTAHLNKLKATNIEPTKGKRIMKQA